MSSVSVDRSRQCIDGSKLDVSLHLSVQSHLCFVSLYSLTFVYLTAEH